MATYRLLQESAPFFREVGQRALADRLLHRRKLPILAFGHHLATRVQFLPRTAWKRKDIFTDRERFLNATICQGLDLRRAHYRGPRPLLHRAWREERGDAGDL